MGAAEAGTVMTELLPDRAGPVGHSASSSGVSALRMQNSLLSGSAITTHDESADCPTSTRVAPRASNRAISVA